MNNSIVNRITNLPSLTERKWLKLSGLSDWLIFFFSAIVISVVFWSLNKGLLFHDEAFYLLHLKNLEIFSTSYWYMFARIIYPMDIIQIRWLTVMLLFISHIIFVSGFLIYFNGIIKLNAKHFISLLALSLLGQFVLWMPVQFVPSYWILNYMLILSSLGFLLISLKQRNNKTFFISAFISGLLIGFIPFIMITNAPLILLMIFVMYMHWQTDEKKEILLFLIVFLMGIITAIILYFALIQGFNVFFHNFKESINHLNHDHSHGILPMIKWIIKSIQYIAVEILLLSIGIILSDLFINRQRYFTLKITVSIVLIAALGFMIAEGFLLSNETGIFSPSIFLVLFFVILYKNIHIKTFKIKALWVFLMLFLMPFIASLGTNVHFMLRGVAYMSVIFVSIYILTLISNDIKYKILFTVFLLIVTMNFLRLPFIPGWTYQILSEQKKPVSNLGIDQNILIDNERYQILEKLKNVIPGNSSVIVSHRSFWGYVYLLDLKIPYLYFDFSETLFFDQSKLHQNNICNYTFIELNTIPFPPGFFDRLKSRGLVKDGFQKIEITDQISVYKNVKQ